MDDVRKYIHKFVENNEIIYKNLNKVINDFENEKKQIANALSLSKSGLTSSKADLTNDIPQNPLKDSNGIKSSSSLSESFSKNANNNNYNRPSTNSSSSRGNNNPLGSLGYSMGINNNNRESSNENNNLMGSLNSGFKTSSARTTSNKIPPNFDYSSKIDNILYGNNNLNSGSYGNLTPNQNNPYSSLNANKNAAMQQNININIINSNINNYVVGAAQKNKPPPTAMIKKNDSKVENPENKASNNLIRNSSYTKKSDVNISNNNLQKIKLIENIYNEDSGTGGKPSKKVSSGSGAGSEKESKQLRSSSAALKNNKIEKLGGNTGSNFYKPLERKYNTVYFFLNLSQQ